MRDCANCGSEIEPDDAFCTGCGTAQAPAASQAGAEGRHAAYAPRAGRPGGPREAAGGTAGTAAAVLARPQMPPPPITPPPPSTPAPAGETPERRYLRQTRNATVFIAVIVGIVAVLTLVGVIWTANTVSKLNSQLTGGGLFTGSNCASQGGTNTSC